MTCSLWAGAKQVTLPRFDSKLYVAAIRQHRPTFLHIVPPIFSFLATSPALTSQDLRSLRQVNTGAAPVGQELIRKFEERAGVGVLYREGWGMSETAAGGTILHRAYLPASLGSINSTTPNYRIRVADTETGELQEAGHTGEIQISGDGVMSGYLDNPAATAATFTADGWLRTGDLGYYTEQGHIFISDRMKELIKVG